MTEKTHKVGSWQIARLVELTLDIEPAILFPDWKKTEFGEQAASIAASLGAELGAPLTLPVHSWILQRDDQVIIVDTGVGNGRTRAFPSFAGLETDFLDQLAALGVTPEKVDFVLNTHIHTDHCGWNTRNEGGRWVPTFPNARYVWGRVDGAIARQPFFHCGPAAGLYQDSIAPIVDAGLVDEVEAGAYEAIDGLVFHSTPGHSPGHMSVSLESNGEMALFAGDVLHSQVQVAHPELNSVFCEDAKPAQRSRRWALEFSADNHALYLGAHLSGSAAGRVKRDGNGFTWENA